MEWVGGPWTVFYTSPLIYFVADFHWGPEWDSSWMHRSSLARRFRHPPSPPPPLRPATNLVKPPPPTLFSAATQPPAAAPQALASSKTIKISSSSGCPACAKLGCANSGETGAAKEKVLHTCLHPAFGIGSSSGATTAGAPDGASGTSPFTLTPDEVKEVLSVLRLVIKPHLPC